MDGREDRDCILMRISQNGVDLLKRFEGLELEAYQDIAGVWTIGYGHTGPDLDAAVEDAAAGIDGERAWFQIAGGKVTVSERAAQSLLRVDLAARETAVADAVGVPLNQNQFDALVSFVYNVGAEPFRGSTALRRLNRGDYEGAADALTWWNKATVNGTLREVLGLTRRRAAEKALFLTPDPPGQAPAAVALYSVPADVSPQVPPAMFGAGCRPDAECPPDDDVAMLAGYSESFRGAIDIACIVLTLIVVALATLMFALAGEPQTSWLWCDVFAAAFCEAG